MQKYLTLTIAFCLMSSTLAAPAPAAALSCLPISDYLNNIIGQEDIVIFTGTVQDTIEDTAYTAEALQVTTTYQGYVQSELMVYHQKHPDWGYLCNTGPAKQGVESMYVATRNEQGQYDVSTRLELDSTLTADVKKYLTAKEITGETYTVTPADRSTEITTTIMDLLQQIAILLKERIYWDNQK